jgi:tetratricopeptide (TPR) repeat protein
MALGQRHFLLEFWPVSPHAPAVSLRIFIHLLWLPVALAVSLAEEAPDAPAVLPSVEDAIPASIKAADTPRYQVFPGGIRMAISTHSPTVQAHVNQGLNHLHGGWEFEAARHFSIAMRQDPECLMAHWGMAMALLNPNPETIAARIAATERLLHLVESDKGTDLERGYAYGLIKYLDEGPSGAAEAFRRVAEKFPREMQAAIFSSLFHRGGYDELGSPTTDQETAEKRLLSLMERHPDSTAPLNALLLIRAEAPDLSASLELARKLCRMAPDYPPYYHLLGHYEWRTGHHREAASAFSKAATLFRNWMNSEKIDLADCPEWVRSECYRVVALLSQGEDETALAAATQLASLAPPVNRPSSPGARALWWDAKTLPARIGMRLDTDASLTKALQSLPPPETIRSIRDHTLAFWWIDGLRIAIDGKLQLKQGNPDKARDVAQALTLHGEAMTRSQNSATSAGERTPWLRSFRALEVIASELRGDISLAGPPERRETAYNWFSSASDRQLTEPMLMPPMVLTPMACRLGHFQLQAGRPVQAVEAFERALARFPNDPSTSRGLDKARAAARANPESKPATQNSKPQ